MFSINTAVTYSSAVATTIPPTNKKKQIFAYRKKDQINGKCSAAIDGTQRAVNKASVDQLAFPYRYVAGFPQPAKKTVYVKPVGYVIEIYSINC